MKIFTKMFFVVALTTMIAFASNAQNVIIESFSDLAAGDSIEVAAPAAADEEPATDWYRNRKSSLQEGVSPVVEEGALSYEGYVASGQGNTVLVDTANVTGDDRSSARHFIDSTTSVKVYDDLFYVSALVKVSDASSGWKEVYSLETNSSGGNFSRGRVYCKLVGDSLMFAVNLNGTPGADEYSPVVCAVDETVLLVLSYEYDPNAIADIGDGKYYTDSVRLYVNPDLSKPAAENVSVANTDKKSGYHGEREWIGMNIRQTTASVLKISSIAWADEWDALYQDPAYAKLVFDDFSASAAGDSLEVAAPATADEEPAMDWYRNRKSSLQEGVSPLVEEGALSYDGYILSGQGNTVLVDTANVTGDDRTSTRHFIDSTTSVKVYDDLFYVSALVKVSDASSGWKEVYSLETNSSGGNFSRGRVYCKLAGDSLMFAVNLNGTPGADEYSPVVCAVDETVLLVLSYEYDPNAIADIGDGKYYTDSVRLYVNPDLSKPAAANVSVANTDKKSGYHGGREWIGMNIRQTTASVLKVSSVAFAADWADLSDGSSTAVKDTNANLSMISVGGVNLEGFNADTLAYEYAIAADAAIPVVLGTTMSSTATVYVSATATTIGEKTMLTVTAEDTDFTKVYSVTFVEDTIGSDVSGNLLEAVNIYPNPSNGTFTIAGNQGSDVVIYTIAGQAVYQLKDISENQAINTNLNKGVYIVTVANAVGRKVSKIIVE